MSTQEAASIGNTNQRGKKESKRFALISGLCTRDLNNEMSSAPQEGRYQAAILTGLFAIDNRHDGEEQERV